MRGCDIQGEGFLVDDYITTEICRNSEMQRIIEIRQYSLVSHHSLEAEKKNEKSLQRLSFLE
jgi:hypothetical protein